MYKDGGIDYQPDSGGTVDDEGNDSNTSKVEDLEVRMDLTDDLLHMVYALLFLFLRVKIVKKDVKWVLLSVLVVVNVIMFF